MEIATVRTAPIAGQKPGTSGLRKKTRVFMEPHFLENYVQAIFDGIGGVEGKTLVLGGDGRYFNDRAAQVILRMAAANGAAEVIVGQGALLSTPAASNLIRLRGTDGGPDPLGLAQPGRRGRRLRAQVQHAERRAPRPRASPTASSRRRTAIAEYRILVAQDVDLSHARAPRLGDMEVEVVDPVADYAAPDGAALRLRRDPGALRGRLHDARSTRCTRSPAPMRRRSWRAASAPPPGTVVNAAPSPDFGGGHPDPNPIWAQGARRPDDARGRPRLRRGVATATATAT